MNPEPRSDSVSDISPLRSGITRFVISHEKRKTEDLNTTLCEENLIPKIKITHDMTNLQTKSLTEPFREYLLSRSVLTATPIDLSILNKSDDDKLTDSLLYCLDGNVPSDLTSSISNLAVDSSLSNSRSPLKSVNNLNLELSPNRKRCAITSSATDNKKIMIEKENFELHETDL